MIKARHLPLENKITYLPVLQVFQYVEYSQSYRAPTWEIYGETWMVLSAAESTPVYIPLLEQYHVQWGVKWQVFFLYAHVIYQWMGNLVVFLMRTISNPLIEVAMPISEIFWYRVEIFLLFWYRNPNFQMPFFKINNQAKH